MCTGSFWFGQSHKGKRGIDFEDEDFSTSGRSEHTHVRAEVFRYLDDPRKDFAMLQDFPAMKAVFVRYNTNLCSSAASNRERLFSFLAPVKRHLYRKGHIAAELDVKETKRVGCGGVWKLSLLRKTLGG